MGSGHHGIHARQLQTATTLSVEMAAQVQSPATVHDARRS